MEASSKTINNYREMNMSRIASASRPSLPLTNSPSGAASDSQPVASGPSGADSFDRPVPPIFSGRAGEKTNWDLFNALNEGAQDGTGVAGVHSLEPAAFYGTTHELPGLKIVFDLDADVDEVIEAIIGAYPEFADYTKTKQWKTWEFLPKWFTLAKRRPVASFLLDTAQ
jgi:hypothetical protein